MLSDILWMKRKLSEYQRKGDAYNSIEWHFMLHP